MAEGISGSPSPLGCICGGTRQASQEAQARVRWCWLFLSHFKLWEAIYNQPQGSTTNRMHRQDEQTVLICSGVSSLRSIMLEGHMGRALQAYPAAWGLQGIRRACQAVFWSCQKHGGTDQVRAEVCRITYLATLAWDDQRWPLSQSFLSWKLLSTWRSAKTSPVGR